jgi:hypothetical protein
MAKLPGIAEEEVREDMDWLGGVDDVDQTTVDSEGPSYPIIQWVNGDKRMKGAGGVPYTGGWFLNAEMIEADELPGWTKGELIHSNNESTEGFFTRDLTFALIRRRRSWRLRVDNKERIFAWDKYDEAKQFGQPFNETPYGRLHVLVVVRGLEDMGPFVLTMRGSISKAFSPSRKEDTIINQVQRLILRPANALAHKAGKSNNWALYAFWLTVGPKRDDKGQPVYEAVGREGQQSYVTLPTLLGATDKMTSQQIGALFVGRENVQAFAQHYRDAEEWQTAFDGMDLASQTTDDDPSGGAEEPETAPVEAANNPYADGKFPGGAANGGQLPF